MHHVPYTHGTIGHVMSSPGVVMYLTCHDNTCRVMCGLS